MTLRSSVGRALAAVFPGLEERAFNRTRNRDFPSSQRTSLRGVNLPSPKESREPHLLVVPAQGPRFGNWSPATGNYFFEVYQSGREQLRHSRVSYADLADATASSWSQIIREMVMDERITHIIAMVEHDPDFTDQWTWDAAWADLCSLWSGPFIGVTFDSGFDLTMMKTRRMARMSPNFVGFDICVPLTGRLVRGRPEIGPVPLTQSLKTLDILDSSLSGVEKTSDVSFIGALYPYRVELIERLRREGITVAVNPHRSDVTSDFASSRRNQPSWIDYMTGLAHSRITLNFSQASSGHDEQLKWRVIEATLAGTLLLTDDSARTSEFFLRGTDYDEFHSAEDLAMRVQHWLTDPAQLEAAQNSAQAKARDLASKEIWRRIEIVLAHRGLMSLSGKSAES